MATTYDLTKAPNALYPITNGNTVKLQKHVLALPGDIATHAASDVAKLITIPAGTFVLYAGLMVKTASTTGSSKVSIGDSAAITTLLAATAATATGYTHGSTGKYYAAADYASIALDATTPPADGIYELFLYTVEVNSLAASNF